MDVVDTLLHRNENFAGSEFSADAKMLPSMKTMIVGCVDPRVDPAAIFELEPGEAVVIRNIGGRINMALLETLAILKGVAEAAGKEVGAGWNLIVLHHTDCGIIPGYHHAPELLAKHLGVEVGQLDRMAITNPYEAVALDVAALRANEKLPGDVTIAGLVYDVKTGRVETIVPAAPLRPSTA